MTSNPKNKRATETIRPVVAPIPCGTQTLQAGFAAAGNARGSPGLAPPWATSTASAFANNSGRPAATHHNSYFADSLEDGFGEGEAGAGATTTASTAAAAEAATTKKTFGGGVTAGAETPSDSGDGVGDAGRAARSEIEAAVHALKLAVVGVTRRLMDDVNRLPLKNRTTAVLVDGSRMSLLALELAGAAWKFGK